MKRRTIVAVALSAALTIAAIPAHAEVPSPAECKPEIPNGPYQIDTQCVDPRYAEPVIDSETDVTEPNLLRRVDGHFEGTDVTFRIFLPEESKWEDRFFQFTYPLDGQEPVDNVTFGAEHGAVTIQTSGTGGYRHVAAAAKVARGYAASYYDTDASRIFGYLYGWSGGSYQVVGAIENTAGVWQGAVPIVQGIETSIPNNYAIRGLAGFVLADKKDSIIAAIRPGGSGDPYLGLDDTERAVLREATLMGIPLRAWEDFELVAATTTLLAFGGAIRAADPGYVADFWSDRRYLGAEKSKLGKLFRAALTEDDTIDNRWNLALLAYHRYALPTGSDFYAYDQYRNRAGSPIHPQRSFRLGPQVTAGVSGSARFDGQLNGKIIALESTYDFDAFPWHRDWYKRQVRAALGNAGMDDSYRLYFTDNADHNPYLRTDQGATRLVGYMPVIYQALLDLSAWVEAGVAPPKSTRYDIRDTQIVLPKSAEIRRGLQPAVQLRAAGRNSESVTVPVGRDAEFRIRANVPRGAGQVVAVEMDFEGDGSFEPVSITPGTSLVVKINHRFPAKGTFYVAARIGSQREGNPSERFTIIQNVDRIRIDVK